MVTFDNGDLVLRIPNMGSFENYLSINAALFEAYDYTLQTVRYANGEFKRDTCIVYLRYLASAMQDFEARAMFAATDAIEAATVREEVRA
jgi:hypothetical protein